MQSLLEEAVRRHFAVPDQEAATMILGVLEPVVCKGGAWLFRQGDEGDALYLLARGLLQTWMASSEPGDGGQRMIAEIAPGEIVGEIGMLAGGKRSAGIRAVRDSLLLRMDAAAFDKLGRQRPELIRHIAGGIAARLRDRTAGPAPVRRLVRTIAVLPLDGAATGDALVPRLIAELGLEGSTLLLTAARMRELGAQAWPQVQTSRCLPRSSTGSAIRKTDTASYSTWPMRTISPGRISPCAMPTSFSWSPMPPPIPGSGLGKIPCWTPPTGRLRGAHWSSRTTGCRNSCPGPRPG
ncbi:MAG: cyclic nucleotide-binding domain-containing protein [Chromatiales bacterium]|nr:MAG: cyclic nucleotide-binding domain-containing protein [Chromatiales bacterium]